MRRLSPRGLTLIELVVSLAIVTVLFSATVVGVGAITGSRAKASVGELGGVVRSLYDTAGLTGKTCRLVMDLGAREEDQELEYRAECAKGAVTRGGEEKEPEKKRSSRDEKHPAGDNPIAAMFPSASDAPSLEDITAREKNRVEEAAKYSDFTTPEIQGRKLSGVKVSVWTAGHKPITRGLAYLYFFPQGYTERAQIVVEQGNNAWTLKVAPLTGKTSVANGKLEPPT